MNLFFWLGASAEEADQALVASDQAASRLAPTGFDPSRCEDCGCSINDFLCFNCINRDCAIRRRFNLRSGAEL